MRYNLESTLPINAFSPRGGRNNPFARGMTLEGGGGGFVGKAIGNVAKAVTGAVKGVVNPIYSATLKNIPGVDKALTGLDKSVSNSIPGGWGTLASIAASFVPGAQFATLGLGKTAAMTGLGALTGSGVMRKGNEFNLQGALMGGAAAYGMANLASGLEAAGGGGGPSAADVASQLGVEGAGTGAGSQAAMLAEQASGMGSYGLQNIASSAAPAVESAQGLANSFAYAPSGEMVPSNIAPDITGSTAIPAVQPQPSGLANLATQTGIDSSAMGQGVGNLSGISGGEGTAAAARAAFTGAGASLTNTAMPIVMGGMGLSDLEAQKAYLDQQVASNSMAQDEYNTQVAEIDRQIAIARRAMADNPWDTNPDRTASVGPTAYDRTAEQFNLYDKSPTNLYQNQPSLNSTFTAAKGGRVPYAMGGSVDDNSGMDEARGLYQGNMQRGFMGGGMPSYAKGGEARERRSFLDMVEASIKSPPAQYVEGMGFVTPPPSVEGRLGGNVDALGGNIRAGASGMAMMGPDKRVMAMPTMMDIGYKTQVGPGNLDVGIQRAMRAAPGRGRDYAVNANYTVPFAKGGEARFLSGGGDGMSDSIPATINGKQEARLADGEFVIPADVVSHLGNGSSKAGAKRLYSMMDKVRKARTGTPKQGKEINPNKFMPA